MNVKYIFLYLPFMRSSSPKQNKTNISSNKEHFRVKIGKPALEIEMMSNILYSNMSYSIFGA